MKKILSRLFEMDTLTEQDAFELMQRIGAGEYNEAQLASLLTVWMVRPVTIEELSGFSTALIRLAIPFQPDVPVIDVCGTGGDGKNTFNISTLTSFVLAGAGYMVAKHGNYGVSSVSGSSTVMEHYGYRFTNDASILASQLEKANICFMHAPLFHPALKHVGNVRRQLGMKTVFNMLGPLVNPARPAYRLTGVFNLEMGRMYHYLLQDSETQYAIVHSLDGYDEISLTGRVKFFTKKEEKVYTPEELGFKTLREQDIFGGETAAEAAQIFMSILEGKGTPEQNNAVLANAAAAIRVIESNLSHEEANSKAMESLLSLKALHSFKQVLE